MVRAKFVVERYETSLQMRQKDGHTGYQPEDMEQVEMRTVVLRPVSAGHDPLHENYAFWRATPSGEIKLGSVGPEAWKGFKLGCAYYVDFIEAVE